MNSAWLESCHSKTIIKLTLSKNKDERGICRFYKSRRIYQKYRETTAVLIKNAYQ